MAIEEVPRREGEDDVPVPIRSGRLYNENGQWFVTTREGKPIGPFHTRDEAEEGLASFVDFIQNANPGLLVTFFRNFLKEHGTDTDG